MLNLVYYMGILACGIQGARKAIGQHYDILHVLFCALLASFAGGFLRDTIVLCTYPAIFELESMLDILLALCSALVYEKTKHKNFLLSFSILADSIGLSQFIVRGVDRAISINASSFIVFSSGIVTALGGGTISSLYTCKSIEEIIFSSLPYWFVTSGGTFIYTFLWSIGAEPVYSQIILLAYTTATATLCNANGRHLIQCYIQKTICCLKQRFNCQSNIYITPFYRWHFLYRLHDEQQDSYNMQYYSSKKIVYMFRRIRQM